MYIYKYFVCVYIYTQSIYFYLKENPRLVYLDMMTKIIFSPFKSLKGWWPWHSGLLQTGTVTGVHGIAPVHGPGFQVLFRVGKASLSHPVVLARAERVLDLKRNRALLPPQMFWRISIGTGRNQSWHLAVHSCSCIDSLKFFKTLYFCEIIIATSFGAKCPKLGKHP